ncbi:MAG TPA: L,D-transpeptidase family protein [Allosphingosinicella sp.]|jgi:lipoprotein-anchoring transpeptidase ErfK/SrfK
MNSLLGRAVSGVGLLLLLASNAPPPIEPAAPIPAAAVKPAPAPETLLEAPPPTAPVEPAAPPPPPPPPPTPGEALQSGVLIVVSLPSQKMFVFRKGELWDVSKVSTGKPGNETPEGIFPILQKKAMHRSNLYDDAPMPFMQRLTWGGVAIHAGRVPGYPASHGCIRLPQGFAKKLYGITRFNSTIVIVAGEPVSTAEEALELA